MKKIKAAALMLLAAVMLCAGALAEGSVTVETLLEDMLAAFAAPSPKARERMDLDAEALGDPVLREVAESWKRLYLDPNPQILYLRRNDPAELEIPDPAHHAFVVLGFSLKDGKVLGAQAIGKKGVDKRIDVIASVLRFGGTIQDLIDLELSYAPPFSSAKDPVNMAGYFADNIMTGITNPILPRTGQCSSSRCIGH